jgi:hypothetical protein
VLPPKIRFPAAIRSSKRCFPSITYNKQHHNPQSLPETNTESQTMMAAVCSTSLCGNPAMHFASPPPPTLPP